MTVGRFGYSSSGSTTPYVQAAPQRRGGGIPAGGKAPQAQRGFPERPLEGHEALIMEGAQAVTEQLPRLQERTPALLNQIGKGLLGFIGGSNKEAGRTEKGPIDVATAAIGSLGRGTPLSVEGLLHVVGEGIQRGGTIAASIYNSQDAAHIREIEKNGLGMDQPINFAPSNPWGPLGQIVGLGRFIPEQLGLLDKDPEIKTVGDYYQSLNDRGFFNSVDKDGNPVQLTPGDLVRKMDENGLLGNYQFGDRRISNNAIEDLAYRMATDPTNIAFMAGLPVKMAAKIGLTGERLSAVGKLAPWARSPAFTVGEATAAELQASMGVGYMEDMATAVGRGLAEVTTHSEAGMRIVAGHAEQGTLRGLGLAMQDIFTPRNIARQVFLPGKGSLALRYTRGNAIQMAAELGIEQGSKIIGQATGEIDDQGNVIHSGFFSTVYDASRSILDDRPLSGNQLFVVASMFGTPFHEAYGAARPIARATRGKLFGEADTRLLGELHGEKQPLSVDTATHPFKAGRAQEDSAALKFGGAKYDEATGKWDYTGADLKAGRAGQAEWADYMNMAIAFERLTRMPGFVFLAKSLDHANISMGPIFDSVRPYMEQLVADGKITSKDRIAMYQKWGNEHATHYLDADGNVKTLSNPGGWNLPPDALLNQWLDWTNGNRALQAATGPMRNAVLARAQTMTQEGMDALISIVEAATVDGGVPGNIVQSVLARRPGMFTDPRIAPNSAEYFAALMNRGVGSGMGVHGVRPGFLDAEELLGHLREVRERIPKGSELTHEATAAEGGILDDTNLSEEGPVTTLGVHHLWSRREVAAHRLRSTTEGRALVRDIQQGEKLYNSRWSRRGKFKGSEQDIVPELNGFHRAEYADFEAARRMNPRQEFMTAHSPEEMATARMYLSEDGLSGFVLTAEGDLQNLFSNAPKGSGAGARALDTAIESGAKTLDAFDGYLTKLYAEHGFVEKSRIPFDPQYAPEGWDYAKYGTPDVVFMEHPANIEYSDPALWEKSLTKAEKKAVDRYADSQYRYINASLRKVPRAGLKPGEFAETDMSPLIAEAKSHIPHLDSAVSKAVLDKTITVYRGVRAVKGNTLKYRDLEAGDTLSDPGFQSFSQSIGSAESFAGTGDKLPQVIFEAELPQGFHAARISGFPEMEVLVGRGQSWTVLGKSLNEDGQLVIKIEPKVSEPVSHDVELEGLRIQELSQIQMKKAQLLEIKTYLLNLRQRLADIGTIPLHYTFRNAKGGLSVSGEDLARVREQAQWVQDNLPQYDIAKPPVPYLPWDAADSAAGALHMQRTTLGRVLFDYGPLAKITQFLDYLIEPVSAAGRVADGKKMIYSQLMRMGASENEVTQFISELQRLRSESGTIGPMKINTMRYMNSLFPNQIEAAGRTVFGPGMTGGVASAGNPAVMEALAREFKGEFTRLLDRSANSLVRRGEQAMLGDKGKVVSGNEILSKSFAKGYAAWQNIPVVAGATRFIDKIGYPYLRFYLSLRWQGMNLLENDILGIVQDGINATRKAPLRESPGVHNMYQQAQAMKFGKHVVGDYTYEGIPDSVIPETGVYAGRWLEPVSHRQFDIRAKETLSQMLDELPIKSPEAQWMIKRFGPTKETWATEIENMWFRWDKDGVQKTLDDGVAQVAAEDRWSPQERAEMLPFLVKLGEKQAQVYEDIAHIQLGNTDRSRLERALNSYWMFWPLSYQIKTTKWMVDVATGRAFGHNTQLGGAWWLNHLREVYQQRMETDPEFRREMDSNPTLTLAFSMFFPATPWDQGVSLSRIPRYIGGNVLHWWPQYAGLNNPGNYAQKALELGSRYDTELLSRLLDETGPFAEAPDQATESGTFTPSR